MKKLILTLMLGALCGTSMAQYGAENPRNALLGSYNVLLEDVFPTNDYQRLCKQRLMQLVPMILNGADANVTLPETKGNTALHYAVAVGYQDLVADLISCGADPYRRNHKGRTPMDCIGSDPDGSMRALINSMYRGGSATSSSYGGETVTIRQVLNQHYIQVQNMRPVGDTQRLYRQRLLTLLPLIIGGSDPNVTLPETKGNTALHYACGMGYYDLVHILLQMGASPRIRTHKGMTPADCASGPYAAQIRNLLLRY
jgi:ankyrin repeat protein